MTIDMPSRKSMPLATFALSIRARKGQRARKKLHVAIWKHLKDLRAAAKRTSGYGGWGDAAGVYIAAKNKTQFGEIYLWIDLIGGGYWAHELQHFMIDYMESTESFPLDEKANERMA